MILLRTVLTIGLVCLAGCATLPPAQRTTTPAATHSHVLNGVGSPTVILEAGLGDGKESWAPVYDQLSQMTRVFAYDRAGYGGSRSSSRTRDGATIVRELRATLQALELEPPYLLVGHSVGGTYMELYARTYPDEIAGVVLVDSRHADFTRQCKAAGARSCEPPALLSALLPSAPKRELADGDKTMEQVMRAGPFPKVPLVVLTSGKQFRVGDRFQEVWLETQESLAALSDRATHTVCESCGHYIHKDKPELVVSAVNGIIK